MLQEYGLWAIFPETIDYTAKAAAQFNQEINQASAHTLLFETWARKPGSKWYDDPN